MKDRLQRPPRFYKSKHTPTRPTTGEVATTAYVTQAVRKRRKCGGAEAGQIITEFAKIPYDW